MNKSKGDIEQQSSSKTFWNKKNYIIITLAILLTIIILALTFVYIYQINWESLFSNMKSGFSTNIGWLWFVILVAFIFWTFFANAFTLTIRLRREGIRVPFWNQFLYTITVSFLRAVTPANFVSDPYTVFWLKTCGLSTSKASALMTNNALLWEIMQIIVTMPSFIWICINANKLLIPSDPNTSKQMGTLVFSFMIVGIAIDFLGLALMFISGFSRKLHYLLSRIFNRTKQFLHLKYHTKQQTYQTYVVEATLQRQFVKYFNDWKITLVVLGVVFVNEVYYYITMIIAFDFLKSGYPGATVDFLEAFNLINVGTTANRFFPLPGGEGSLETILITFFNAFDGVKVGPNDDKNQFVVNSVMIWRTFTQYIPAVLGLFGFGTLTIKQIQQYRKKKMLRR